MEATKEKAQLVNGVNTEQLFSTIDLIKENPDIAKFKFRATNKWINGTHCRGTINDFYGALKEEIMKGGILSSIFLWLSPAVLLPALLLMDLPKE
jgi:hypothetical protein